MWANHGKIAIMVMVSACFEDMWSYGFAVALMKHPIRTVHEALVTVLLLPPQSLMLTANEGYDIDLWHVKIYFLVAGTE